MKLPNRLSKIPASASIHHPPASDRMLSKSKLQTSSPAAAKARLPPAKHASTSQEASTCLNAISNPPSVRVIPRPPEESKPPDAKTTQSTRKITHQFHQTPHPQVPAPHVASVSLGVPCIVLVRLTPSPYVKKNASCPFPSMSNPPVLSNPFRLSLLWSQCIDRRSLGVHMLWSCLSAKRHEQTVVAGSVCRGVLIKSSSERRWFTPSRAAAASRQWLMPLVAVRGTSVSPAPRRIRPSGILPSPRCWRTPSRRGGV